MIKFTWLQYRTQAIVTFVALTVVAIVLAATERHISALYYSTVSNCASLHDCAGAASEFTKTDGPLFVTSGILLLVAPALLGAFWGAPLIARELEAGTFRIAWTQSATRTRWIGVKLATVGLGSLVVVGVLSLTVTWWASLLDRVNMEDYNALVFSARDVVPIAYTAFAFMLGAATGLFMRRTLPAVFITLVGFAAVRWVVAQRIRPKFFTPLTQRTAISLSTPLRTDFTQSGVHIAASARGILPNDWITSVKIVNDSGHVPTQAFLNKACPLSKTSVQPSLNLQTCLSHIAAKYHELVTYQPHSRYWSFQWFESGVFLGLAAILAVMCVLWIRRPMS